MTRATTSTVTLERAVSRDGLELARITAEHWTIDGTVTRIYRVHAFGRLVFNVTGSSGDGIRRSLGDASRVAWTEYRRAYAAAGSSSSARHMTRRPVYVVVHAGAGHQTHAVLDGCDVTVCGRIATAVDVPRLYDPSFSPETNAARRRPSCRTCQNGTPANWERVTP